MNIYIRETARAMAARGVLVDVFTRQHLDPDEAADWGAGCRLIHVPAGPLETANGDLRRRLRSFADEVVERTRGEMLRYEGIVSHYWLSGLVAHRLREHWGAPHVAGFHTLALAKPEAFRNARDASERVAGEREVIARADLLLAATPHDRATLVADYSAAPSRIVQAPPGVDTRRFRPLNRSECCRRLGLQEAGRRLLFVGRTIPLKGIPMLLEALSRLPAEVSAVIVGGSPEDSERRFPESTAGRLGVTGRVQFVDSVPHDQLPFYFGAADVCVVPSYYESYGMVALEALACGRPVVASRVGGLSAVVDHGVNGLLVAPGSPGELADALLMLLGNENYREALGRAGVAKAQRCSWERTTTSILGALAEREEVKDRVDTLAATPTR